MRTPTSILKTIFSGAVLLISISAFAQDDLYYMPSTDKDQDEVKAEKYKNIDTSGMTDYQKYRAYRDGKADTSEEQSNAKEEKLPDYTAIDTAENGAVTVNNFYIEDRDWRYNRYRNFYFDYYDPFYWDNSPYFGFNYWGGGWGWSLGLGFYDPYPYYGGYGYWGYPSYWYYPTYYSGYYSYYNGYYDGYNNGNYQRVRSQLHTSGGSRRLGSMGPAISSGRNNSFAESRNGFSTRRTSTNTPSTSAFSSRRGGSGVYNTTTVARSRSTVTTTRPYQESRRSYYVPSYNRGDNATKQYYYNNSGSTRRQVSTYQGTNYNSGRTYNNTSSAPSRNDQTVAPRRSSETYSAPARSSGNSGASYEGNSRRSSGSSYSGGSSYSSPSRSSSSSSGNSSSGGGGSRRR